MTNRLGTATALLCALALPGIAPAFTIYDSFGEFPDATWGGTGIPNDAVAASRQIIDGDTTITVAMNATGRFSNPQLTNNGAAVYFATPGSNFGGNNESATEGALWNWNYYIDIDSPDKVLADYQIDIWYDFDPSGPRACCDLTGSGRIDVTAFLLAQAPATTLVEDSQNLLFNFLAVDNAPFLFSPSGSFDPDALGNYQFAITVTTGGAIDFPVDAVAMEVQVVPVPPAVLLFGSALGLLGWIRRRIS
jgi:hypothetical protein